MASFVDAREAFNGCRRYSATHLQPVFLPLRTFVSSIRGTKDEEREREEDREDVIFDYSCRLRWMKIATNKPIRK